MIQFLKYIVVFLSCATCNYFCFDFMNSNFQKKQKGNYFFYLLIFILCNFITNLFENAFFNYLWSLISVLILSFLLYKSKTKNTFFPLFLFLGFIALNETIVCYFLEFFFNFNNISYDYFYYIAVFCSNVTLLLFYKPVKYFLSDKSIQQVDHINLYDGIILVFSFIIIMLFSFFLKLHLPTYLHFILILICLLIFIFDIYLVIFLDNKIKNKQLEYELNAIKQQRQLDETYYAQKNELYNQQMKLFHDLKKHLSVIEQMYKEGSLNEASNYTNDLMNKMSFSSISVNNKVLRILMNDFIDRCHKNNISLHYQIDSRIAYENINEMDLVTLYSNIMNNAIEASLACSNPNIDIKVFIHRSMVITEIENSYSGKLKVKKGHFYSTKEYHFGYGIANIKEIMDKYDGYYDFIYTDNTFKVTLILPLED